MGVLGAATITPVALLDPAGEHPHVRVDAIAARDPRRASEFARKHGIDRVHSSYGALVEDPDIDAVYIPTPNGLHGVWTRRAVLEGKHVLCEKPFTANASEAAEVAKVVAASDRVVMEAFHWRYHPMAERMIEIVRSGELGRIRHLSAAVCFPLVKPSDIRYRYDLAGGALMDAGCYAINIIRTLSGQEPDVVGVRAKMMRSRVDRAFKARLQFPSGATGTVRCSLFSARLLDLRVGVYGTRGEMKVFNPLQPKLLGSIKVEAGGRRRTEQPEHTSTYRHQLDAFASAILDGTPFPTTVEDAVKNMTVIDQLYRAAGVVPRQPTTR